LEFESPTVATFLETDKAFSAYGDRIEISESAERRRKECRHSEAPLLGEEVEAIVAVSDAVTTGLVRVKSRTCCLFLSGSPADW